jgi:hypothetical protein
MSCFKVLALAATLALGSLTLASEASAHGPGGMGHAGGHWGGGGHWAGGHWGGVRRFGFGGGYWGPGYYAYAGCWRWRRVWTPVGPVVRRVNVCYYPPY